MAVPDFTGSTLGTFRGSYSAGGSESFVEIKKINAWKKSTPIHSQSRMGHLSF